MDISKTVLVKASHTQDELKEIIWHAVSGISRQEFHTAFNMFTRCPTCLIVVANHSQ
jgi:hypothetical protein